MKCKACNTTLKEFDLLIDISGTLCDNCLGESIDINDEVINSDVNFHEQNFMR